MPHPPGGQPWLYIAWHAPSLMSAESGQIACCPRTHEQITSLPFFEARQDASGLKRCECTDVGAHHSRSFLDAPAGQPGRGQPRGCPAAAAVPVCGGAVRHRRAGGAQHRPQRADQAAAQQPRRRHAQPDLAEPEEPAEAAGAGGPCFAGQPQQGGHLLSLPDEDAQDVLMLLHQQPNSQADPQMVNRRALAIEAGRPAYPRQPHAEYHAWTGASPCACRTS